MILQAKLFKPVQRMNKKHSSANQSLYRPVAFIYKPRNHIHMTYLVLSFLCPANNSPCIQALLLLPFALLDLHSSSRLFGLVNASVGKQWPVTITALSLPKNGQNELHACHLPKEHFKRQDMEFSSPSPSFSWELMSSTSESRNLGPAKSMRKLQLSCWQVDSWICWPQLTMELVPLWFCPMGTHGTHKTHRTRLSAPWLHRTLVGH